MATVTLAFYAQFTASKAGLNGLSPTVDLERITRADGTRSALRTGVATNITIGRRGLYGYYETGCDLDLYDYVATFITADTSVDLKEVPALWTYWIADIGDAAIASVTGAVGSVTAAVTAGTVSDKTGYSLASAPPTAAAIADAVWDETAGDHTTTGSTGKALASAGAASDPLLNTVPGSYASGSAGAALGRIGSGQITTVAPVSQSGTAEVVRGMDYSATDGLALDWTFTANPDLTGASVALYIYSGATLEATWTPTVITPTAGAGKVRVQATNAQTGALRETAYAFAIWATLTSGRKVQLYAGTLVVLPELRP